MGLASGNVTLVRYKILGQDKPLSAARIEALLAPRRARAVRLEGVEAEELSGWARPSAAGEDVDSPDKAANELSRDSDAWHASDAQVGEWLLLRLRIERRKVPTSLFQLMFRQKILALAEKRGKPVARAERLTIREELRKDLVRRTLPNLSWIDASWRDRTGDLLLFGSSEKVRQIFEEQFRKTFAEPLELEMVRVAPPLAGLDHLEPKMWTDAKRAAQMMTQLSTLVPVTYAGSGAQG